MGYFFKFFRRRRANSSARTIVAHKIRKARFNGVIALPERVIIGVRDFWSVLGIIEVIVVGDFAGQPFVDDKLSQFVVFDACLEGVRAIRTA